MKKAFAVSGLALSTFVATLSLAPLAAHSEENYRQTGADVLRLRSGPSTRRRIIGRIRRNQCVVGLGSRSGRWIEINYRGTDGWASGNYLDEDASCRSAAAGGYIVMPRRGLNLRRSPSSSSRRLTIMPQGSCIASLHEDDGNWARVEYEGHTGWASKNYLDAVSECG